jgi:hypothetical protein
MVMVVQVVEDIGAVVQVAIVSQILWVAVAEEVVTYIQH